jgi:hypothetical protein
VNKQKSASSGNNEEIDDETSAIVSAAREIMAGFQAAINEVYHDTRQVENLISMASTSLTTSLPTE